MDAMSQFGMVIGGMLGVLLVPVVTLRMSLGKAVIWGPAVAVICLIVGRAVAHFGVGPMLNAPPAPFTLAQKLLPLSGVQMVVSGVFMVLALAICIMMRQWRKT